MKHVLQLSALLCAALPAAAQAGEFEDYLKAQQQGVQQQKEAFAQYRAEVTRQFDNYLAEQARLFKEYKDQIEKKWGAEHAQTSTKKEYVAYERDYSARKVIDFESGHAKVELLLSESEAQNAQEVAQKLKEQVAQLATARGGSDPLEVKNAVPPDARPILSAQLQTPDGKPVTGKNAAQYAEQVVRPELIQRELITGKDGVQRVAIGVQVPLVPNHIKLRAQDYRERVRAESSRFGIDPALVFAIMHTESYFNPKARSPVPAYGLMQLVPKSGARDAYIFAYKKDALVTGEYLFVPDNNIELGTAYLTKLMTVEFSGINDPRSRIYCTISAYNTGPGNVARAFTGKRNVSEALPRINAMTSEQVFEHLRRNLPFEETRQYVARVSERMGLYEEWAR